MQFCTLSDRELLRRARGERWITQTLARELVERLERATFAPGERGERTGTLILINSRSAQR